MLDDPVSSTQREAQLASDQPQTDGRPAERVLISRLTQYTCQPDRIHGTIQNPKWICDPIDRFFKLVPSKDFHTNRLISEEILPEFSGS